ncbi:hypothetical protein E3J61_02930 [Candidatus Dependentiae bacterium]|nr:MAG: hypothetical protein E3J61_02930 [Candidatus Dependentiae bacterium]
MKKIQSRYLLWALVATFSLNVAAPIFAEEPKQEKLSFAQRIKLLIRAKEWLKETNELRKKIKAGTATEEEKKRLSKRIIGITLILLLLVAIPFVWFVRKEDQEVRELLKIGRASDRSLWFGIEKGALEAQESRDIREALEQAFQRMLETRQQEYYNLRVAALVRTGRKTREEALEAIQRDLQQDLLGKKSELLGSPIGRANAVLKAAMKKERELLENFKFNILDVGERETIKQIMRRMKKAKKAGSSRSLR